LGISNYDDYVIWIYVVLRIYAPMLDLNIKQYQSSAENTEWFYFDNPIVYIGYWHREGPDNGGLSNVYANVKYNKKLSDTKFVGVVGDIPISHIFRRNEWIMNRRESKIEELINHLE